MIVPITLDQISSIYQEAEKSKDSLFVKENRKIEVPVNLNIFEAYYKTFEQFRYFEVFEYLDKTLIFDIDSYDLAHKKDYFLPNLKWLSDFRHFSKWNKDPSGIRHFVDWSNNGLDLDLKNILNLDFSKRSLFVPQAKDIFLSYEHFHSPVIPEYAYYFSDLDSLKNHYGEIGFGRVTPQAKKVEDLMFFGKSLPKVDKCYHAKKSFFEKSMQVNPFFTGGFDGICDSIATATYHYAFPTPDTVKWTTPYVAYKWYAVNSYMREYYYYLLGDFSDNQGRSINLFKDKAPENLWFVDYDNIFKLDFNSSELTIELNANKLPENLLEFFKVSSLFKFQLSLTVNSKQQVKEFDMKELITNGSIKLGLESNESLVSNVFLKVSSTSEDVDFIIDDKKTYRVDTKELENKGFIYEKIVFDRNGSKNYMPSQFLDDQTLLQFFYMKSSKNKLVRLKEDLLKDLNVSVDFDDIKGTANISFDLEDTRENVYLTGLKKFPDFNNATILAQDTKTALDSLKTKFPYSPQYFWDSIDLSIPEFTQHHFDEKIPVLVAPKKELNERIKKQWNFDLLQIHIHNPKSLAPIFYPHMEYSELSSLFALNDYAKGLKLTLDDYRFELSEDEEGILVTFNPKDKYKYQNHSFQKTYYFPYNHQYYPSLSGSSVIPSQNNEDSLFSGLEKIMLGVCGTASVLGIGLYGVQHSSYLRKFLKFSL